MTRSPIKLAAFIAGVYMLTCCYAFGSTPVSLASGNWSNPAIWPQSRVPGSTDNVIIASGQTITVDVNANVSQLTVDTGALLIFLPNMTLTINGTFTVNGTVTMNGGNIALPVANTAFILGANSFFTWDPGANDAAHATLFVNGTESFAPTSTLIIKQWYNYTTLPLGSVVSGNFGNLVINTNSSGTILEWNQNNQFETNKILGTLTVDQGWVTLDKSGAISNTTIGNIILTSANSYFTAYNGTAAPNFTLTTSNITNNGGTFFGIYNGKGNITLNVTGNITNTGNIKLIDNNASTTTGTCNGNVTLTVGGTFSQSAGDTRFIYNLYSTASGIYNAKIGTLNLTGGILMGQYSCHTSAQTSTFNVVNNFTLTLSNATDKFRCIGLSNISTNVNNQKLSFTVGGNLTISGNAVAEFTSDASSGDETDSIRGNVQVTNCTNSFNYGSAVAAHNTILIVGGSMTVNGGSNYLSRMAGSLTSAINGNLTLTNGNLVVKGDSGNAVLTINGAFNQSGGKFFHHSNYSTPDSDNVSVIINGDFNQSSGIINFDDCTLSTGSHSLSINGSNYNLSGMGVIMHTGAASFGNICFGRQGNIQFKRSGNSHSIQQVKQYIKNGCTLNVDSGNMQLASSDSTGNYFLEILNGGALNMSTFQLFSNAVGANCAIDVDSGGTLKTGRTQGLYDGTSSACINASSNMYYFLDANSAIEYNGSSNQVVTGTGSGIATSVNQKYGILTVNFNGIPNANYVYPAASNVYIRTRLVLSNGELNLNGNKLTIESGLANAVTRINGYVKSETNAAYNPSIITWKNVSGGPHIFPFGVNASGYVPVTFTPTSGMGGDVSVSTRATSSSDNAPLPTVSTSSLSPVTVDQFYLERLAIDRWWSITANGFVAGVTLSYLGSENTMNDTSANRSLQINEWNGSSWIEAPPSNNGVTSGIGTVSVSNASVFSSWMITGQPVIPVVSNPLVASGGGSTGDPVIQSLGPNPFDNQVNIVYTLTQNGPVYINITDYAGKLLYTETVDGVAGSNNYTFNDNANLNPGLYMLSMTFNGNTVTKKIVKN